MNISIFKDIFENRTINKKSIVIVELIFIIFLISLIVGFNNLYDYYNNSGEVKDSNISTIVNVKDLDIITSNNEMIIKKKTYNYEVNSIEENNYISNGLIFKIVNIKVKDYDEINNNYIEYQIIKDKETILDYFIKTLKGG